MAIGFGAESAVAAIALALLGTGERGIYVALQATARLSFALFVPAYCGSAMVALFGSSFDFIKQSVRDFGLAFAAAHLVHLSLVVWLCHIGAAPQLTTFVFFGIAAVWTWLLAVLSIARLRRAVGQRRWRSLNSVGLNFIALAFAVDFMRFPFRADARYLLGYLPFIILAIAGPVLRVASWALKVYQNWRNSTSPAH